MRIVLVNEGPRVAVLRDDHVVDVNWAYERYAREKLGMVRPTAAAASACPSDLDAFIKEGPRAIESARTAIAYLDTEVGDGLGPGAEGVCAPIDQVSLRPPLTREARVFMAMGNFAKHVWQFRQNQGDTMSVDEVAKEIHDKGGAHFIKLQQNVITTGDSVRLPKRAPFFDYEAEVGVVIGKSGRDIAAGDFRHYIWGYVMLNDWSVRADKVDLANFGHTKNFDTALSVGPWIAVDEDIDPQAIPIECTVNGDLRQRGSTADMVLSFAELAEYLSTDMTLLPGDIIGGGTPEGCAVDSSPRDESGHLDPTLFLSPGDEVVVSSPELGKLANVVRRSE